MKYTLTITVLMAILLAGCDREILPPAEKCEDGSVSYDNGVKEIIDLTCSYSGCHDGASAPGNFLTFEGLERYLNDGSFTSRVIDLKDNPTRGMPPNQSIYSESQQDDLTEVQLEIIKCWIQNDFIK